MNRLGVKTSLAFIFLACLIGSCDKNDPLPGIELEDGVAPAYFSGVYIVRGPGMDNSINYLVPDVSPYRQNTKHLFSSVSIRDISDKTYINAVHSVDHPSVSLSKGQYLRMLYFDNTAKSKWVVMRPGTLDGTLALRATERDAAFDKTLLGETKHWFIIHDFSDDDKYRWVAIESLENRGYYLMDAGTSANANAVRLMQRADVREATRWEIHKP